MWEWKSAAMPGGLKLSVKLSSRRLHLRASLSASHLPPENTFTLVDVLARFTRIVAPIAGAISARGHGRLGIGLGILFGVLTGRAGEFSIRWLDSRLQAICQPYADTASEDQPGCALELAILGANLLIAAIPLIATQAAGYLAKRLVNP